MRVDNHLLDDSSAADGNLQLLLRPASMLDRPLLDESRLLIHLESNILLGRLDVGIVGYCVALL